ncbi:MAG: PqqD family peptide modification chaperone [Sulfuritalea sp.]|nr:PqqD family peptide modification chaperone [Sulfuritalea sp.]MBK8119035.1 PqqD family peptide modification chaperone [Sulfuritalea sp.]
MSGATAMLSTNWYRVAGLKPRLRGHVRIHRHAYRGEIWYVIEDRVAGKYHRFNPASYRVISLMDGRRSMEGVWKRLTDQLADDTPAQEDVIKLLGQMHASDLIQCDVDPDVAELFERRGKQIRRQWMSRYLNPIALRFALWDPDRFLIRAATLLRPFAGIGGLLLWLAVVLPALILAPSHWLDLTRNFSEQLLTLDNIIVMALVFPLIKACHELGHGLAVRARGGEVHEMGIMLLVLFPLPYVDASSSSAFVKKTDRMLVGAAGMLTELFIAALAFYAWLLLEPGFVRSLAYNIIVLASVTTLLFNANPLLRYDGYYVLADWAEIPNLASRANQYWQYLAERYVFGVSQAQPPPASAGERRWFIGYAPLAFAYRLVVLFGITLFIAQQYFILGVALALWGLVASLGVPLYKGIAAVMSGPQYAARANRVRAVLAGVVVVLLLFLFVVPFPYHTKAQGVVWLPEQAILRTRVDGFVTTVLAEPGNALAPGVAVMRSHNPVLATEALAQASRLEEVQARYDAAWGVRPAQAGQIEGELRREQEVLARLQDEVAKLTLRAEATGILLMDKAHDLPGRFMKKGEVVGYVVGEYLPLVRVVVPQSLVDPVRESTRSVDIRLPQNLAASWPARLIRAVPKAARELPSPALGKNGGGEIAVDPQDSNGIKTLESLFEFELELPKDVPGQYLGSRVYVRFEHPAEPVGYRAWRGLRRLFLSQFHV